MRIIIIFLFYVHLGSCKNDSSEGNKPDCQANNYGIFRINIASTTLRHHILITIGFGVREKDLEAGVLTDTMHLPPGTYSTFITSNTAAGGAALDSDVGSITIEQCKEAVRSVPF